MSIYINKCDLFNEIEKIEASPDANEFKCDIYALIDEEDGIDAIDITHCMECMYCNEEGGHANCAGRLTCSMHHGRIVDELDYCSFGRMA